MFRFANHFPIEILCIFEARFFTSEKMNETRKRLIVDLLERYKEKFLETPLSKDGVDELYKWELITYCKGKSTIEIIKHFIATKPNVIYRQGDIPVFSYLVTNNELGLEKAFNLLNEENLELSECLNRFKKAMSDLCGDKYDLKANDERTASAFLACWNPQKYTFYMNGLYKNYCEYIGEQPRAVGEKYPHYLQLLPELIEIIKQDAELMNKFRNETNGLIQSDLLIAQNILWQMKDIMKNKNRVQGLIVRDSTGWQKEFLADMSGSGYGIIWKHQISDINEVLPQLRSLIETQGGFDFYNISNNKTNYKYTIVDFATKKDYDGKIENWESKNPCWFSKNFSDYSDDNKYAQIVFLVNEVEEIKPDSQINIDDFVTFNNKKASIQNAVAYEYIKTKIFKQNMKQIDKFTKILSLKKNIILQGAPGTGKTYNTAALALSICGETIPESHEDVMKRYEELRKEGRIGFCTFHQSMDYEDFVEGIKPKTENGAISYDVEDGIFKALSDKARENYEDSQKTIEVLQKQKSIQDKMYDFLQDALENRTEFLTRLGYKFIITEITDKNIIVSIITENNIATGEPIKNSTLTIRLSELTELLEKEVVLNEIGDIPAYFNRKTKLSRDYYTFYIANEINKIKTKNVNVQKTELQNYVLIIDEINRGNVSKIFGELITLLEADKRIGGEHPIKVTLPYSKESFGVPSNLYIIGTMNTTDRSVGNIDYAVRRRFAFVTLESKEEVIEEHYRNDESLKNKALGLFNSVKSFLEKHKFDMDIADLMVGHSYFLAKDEEELGLKWKYEIVPLLHEYYKDRITKQDVKADTSIDDFCNSK